ncbi:CopG family transcriptional regulator [archaeon]
MSNYTTVSIPTELADKVKDRIAGTGFRSMSEYTTYVLRQIVSSAEMREDTKAFTKEDKEEIKHRLKALGYI